MKDIKERLIEKVDKTGSCWIWKASKYSSGYGQFWNGKKIDGAHRVSYRLFKGDIPNGHVVMHRCDNKICVNPEHLAIGTALDNMRDMYQKGRHRSSATYDNQRGEKAWNAVLTNSQAQEIRDKYSKGNTSWLKLAKEYGVSKKTIGGVVRGARYG